MLGQLASTIEHRKLACGGSLTQQLEMEGRRINEVTWAQKEFVRRKAQEQKDIIDQQAEAAMSHLDRRRNEQVMGLHHDIYNQRSELESQAAQAALDCYMQFERASPEIMRTQSTPQMPRLEHSSSVLPPPPPPHTLLQAEMSRNLDFSRGNQEQAHPAPWIGLNSQHFQPQAQPVMTALPMQLGQAGMYHQSSQMLQPLQLPGPMPVQAPSGYGFVPPRFPRQPAPTAAFNSSPVSPRVQVVEFPVPAHRAGSPPGSPKTAGTSALGSSVQVVAEEEDSVDEYGRHSTRRIFSISGMDGEPLAIVQMLK